MEFALLHLWDGVWVFIVIIWSVIDKMKTEEIWFIHILANTVIVNSFGKFLRDYISIHILNV